MAPFQRDPVSLWFDAAAARLAERAYDAGGDWAGIYLAPPTSGQRQRLAAMEVDPMERDRWGEVRWVRAFKRSFFHLVNYYGGVEGLRDLPHLAAGTHGWHAPVRPQWQTGARVMRAGWPARRWAIRVALHPAGEQTSRIGQRARLRWVDDAGHPTRRQSTVRDHTWESAF